MSAHNHDIVFAVFGLCLHFVFTNASLLNIHSHRDCDLKLCPGPLWYYKEIGCTPIFENTTSCCPTRYNCDVLETLPRDKCLVNGRVYDKNQEIEAEDIRDRCVSCDCYDGYVLCTMILCPGRFSEPIERKADSIWACPEWRSLAEYNCCNTDGKKIRSNCTYHGISYRYGEKFISKTDPERLCTCGKSYTGSNDTDLCDERKPSWCDNVVKSLSSVRAHCVPVYAPDKSPQTDCNVALQCPNENENYVIRRPGDIDVSTSVASESENTDKRCRFGNLTMRIGEEFSSSNWHGTYRCTCEIPPVPTCRLFSAAADESTV